MKLKGIPIDGFRIKDGKAVKVHKPRDKSREIAMRKSKKQRVVRKGAV